MNDLSKRVATVKALAFLRDLHALCVKHKATVVGCLECHHPGGSVGSVNGDELASLAACSNGAVATLYLARRTVMVPLSAEHGELETE